METPKEHSRLLQSRARHMAYFAVWMYLEAGRRLHSWNCLAFWYLEGWLLPATDCVWDFLSQNFEKLWSWLFCPRCDVGLHVRNLWSTSGWKAFCKHCYSSGNNRARALNVSWHHSQPPPLPPPTFCCLFLLLQWRPGIKRKWGSLVLNTTQI